MPLLTAPSILPKSALLTPLNYNQVGSQILTKQFSDSDLNIEICYLKIHFYPIYLLYSCPMNFSSNSSKSFLSKYLFDSMIFHTTVDQLEMDEKNTVKKLSSFLTPNWSFELCQLPRLKKIEIVVANNVMWYTIQCRQPLF